MGSSDGGETMTKPEWGEISRAYNEIWEELEDPFWEANHVAGRTLILVKLRDIRASLVAEREYGEKRAGPG